MPTVDNVGKAVKVNNIDDIDTVVVDYKAPTIDSIILKNYTEDSKAGDEIQIKVTFADKTKGTTELIQVPIKQVNGEDVYQFPIMKLSFGGKEAKGKMTAEFEKIDMQSIIFGEPGSEDEESSETDDVELPYSNSIIYTYTLTEEDKQDISLESIKGTAYDMAKNKTEINRVKNQNTDNDADKDTDNNTSKDKNNKPVNNNQNINNKDNMATGKLPYTGVTVGTGIISIIVGVISIILRKR